MAHGGLILGVQPGRVVASVVSSAPSGTGRVEGSARGGPADVVYVLMLLQVGAGLLAAVGPVVVSGNPGYLLGPVVRAILLLVLAAGIVRGRRWALVAAIVVEWVGLLGVLAGLLLGLTPQLVPSMTVTGLLTEIGIPVAVIWLCARLLSGSHLSGSRALLGPLSHSSGQR